MQGDRALADASIVLFDGVCNLCNAFVLFVIDRDPRARFRFASLQSEAGRAILRAHGLPEPAPGQDPASLVLVEGARAFEQSSAALRILRGLSAPARWAFALVVVPRPVRDAVYRFVARRRYGWFGRSRECRVPTPDLAARLLE